MRIGKLIDRLQMIEGGASNPEIEDELITALYDVGIEICEVCHSFTAKIYSVEGHVSCRDGTTKVCAECKNRMTRRVKYADGSWRLVWTEN